MLYYIIKLYNPRLFFVLHFNSRCLLLGYTSQGGSALVAVDGLTSLLKNSEFFEPDVVSDEEEESFECEPLNYSTRLTLLDLTIQVVCDVATSSARETYFRSCVDFVSDAVRYANGKLSDRTVGFVLRFYLFVFYFGASIPSCGWPFDTGMSDDVILSANTKSFAQERPSLVGVYLPGGAPQAAALALKELVSVILGRLEVGMKSHAAKTKIEESSLSNVQQVSTQFSENLDEKMDVANLIQLASYQIHRSGGSELFWHDMINSCGSGLFGQDNLSTPSLARANILSFAILASFVKISSGKVRVISNSSEPVPRDVASKLLSLELLLCFIETWHDSVHGNRNAKVSPSIESRSSLLLSDEGNSGTTMVYVMRRLIVPTILSNTSSALEDYRVYRRALQIISTFWTHSFYRNRMKLDLTVLMEHFVLKMLCMGPQVNKTAVSNSTEGHNSSAADCAPSLLNQQLDVLSSMSEWFSSNHIEIIDYYVKFDLGHDGSLPVAYCSIVNNIIEALCNLAEHCGSIICEHSQFTSINGANSSPRKSIANPRASDLSEMAHVRETAQMLRAKSFEVITLISQSMMRCASIKQKSPSPVRKSLVLEQDVDQLDTFGLSPLLSPASDMKMIDDNNIIDYWHTSIEKRKAPLQPIFYEMPSRSQESNSSQSLSIKGSRSEDSSKFSISQHKKEALEVAFDLISTKGLKKGLDYLIASHILTPSPREVSTFLRVHQSSINPEILGEYLGEGGIDGSDKEYWNHIRFNYARAVSFVGMNIEQG